MKPTPEMETCIIKAKSVKQGDTLYSEFTDKKGNSYKNVNVVRSLRYIDKETINLDFGQGGSGLYHKNSNVKKIINPK